MLKDKDAEHISVANCKKQLDKISKKPTRSIPSATSPTNGQCFASSGPFFTPLPLGSISAISSSLVLACTSLLEMGLWSQLNVERAPERWIALAVVAPDIFGSGQWAHACSNALLGDASKHSRRPVGNSSSSLLHFFLALSDGLRKRIA